MCLKQTKCMCCKHYWDTQEFDDNIPRCDAFPEPVEREEDWKLLAIPQSILNEKFDHTKPYPGDHGIRFEPYDSWKEYYSKE